MVTAMFSENGYFSAFIILNCKGMAKPSFRVIRKANAQTIAWKVACSESSPSFGGQVVG